MRNLKYFILLVLFPIFTFSALVVSKIVFAPQNFNPNFKAIKINNSVIVAEIADTPEKQAKGLSGRQALPENQGMLFVFNTSGYYSFWMKDTRFNLDFIWMNDNKVVEISKNIRPEDYQPASTRSNRGEPPEELIPKYKVDSVLEVNAGIADKIGIKEGDMVE